MSYDRQGGQIVFECDECPAVLETEESGFLAALDVLREAGWRSRKGQPGAGRREAHEG